MYFRSLLVSLRFMAVPVLVMVFGVCAAARADIPSIGYIGAMEAALRAELEAKAQNNDVVHKTENEEISGIKTFKSNAVFEGTVTAPVTTDSANDNQVATAGWVKSNRGMIPVGDENSTSYTKMWVEE